MAPSFKLCLSSENQGRNECSRLVTLLQSCLGISLWVLEKG